MKTFWICVFLIPTVLGATFGSGNTYKEGYWSTWTWQNTFDLMITLWMLNYFAIALYLTFQYTYETIRQTRLQRHMNQLELKRQRAAQPKTWKRKPKKKQRKKQGEW